MAGAVLGTWTAFESLAGDLWVKAVNIHPQKLASLTGSSERIQGRTHSSSGHGGFQEKVEGKKLTISDIDDISMGTFNLGELMGALHARSERVSFDSLKKIRTAYSLAFSEKISQNTPEEINKALSKKHLDSISLIRNLLVHKAGIVDSKYLKESSGIPGLPPLAIGQKLDLDGELTRTLINPVIDSSIELIKGVDSWIQRSITINSMRKQS